MYIFFQLNLYQDIYANYSFANEKKYQKDSIKIEKKFKYIKCSNALWHNKYLK